jgi:hypothetical protein
MENKPTFAKINAACGLSIIELYRAMHATGTLNKANDIYMKSIVSGNMKNLKYAKNPSQSCDIVKQTIRDLGGNEQLLKMTTGDLMKKFGSSLNDEQKKDIKLVVSKLVENINLLFTLE